MHPIGTLLRYNITGDLCCVKGYREGAFERLYLIAFFDGFKNPAKLQREHADEWNNYEVDNFFEKVA